MAGVSARDFVLFAPRLVIAVLFIVLALAIEGAAWLHWRLCERFNR